MTRQRPSVLLTGGSRFLGRGFLDRWADRYQIIAVGRTPVAGASDWIQCDLHEPLPLSRLPRRVDAVVHLASLRTPTPDQGPQALYALNAGAVDALLDYARAAGARRFVLGSTGGVCGYRRRAITETTPPAPFDAYTMSKWHGETIARQQPRGVRVAIVRYFFPYGPGQEAGIIPRLAERIGAGEPVLLHAGGRHPRLNPVYIDDACELTRRALDAAATLTVNCAGPQTATVREMSAIIGGRLDVVPRFAPSPDAVVGDMVASLAAARRALRWTPQVALPEGIAATLPRR